MPMVDGLLLWRQHLEPVLNAESALQAPLAVISSRVDTCATIQVHHTPLGWFRCFAMSYLRWPKLLGLVGNKNNPCLPMQNGGCGPLDGACLKMEKVFSEELGLARHVCVFVC